MSRPSTTPALNSERFVNALSSVFAEYKPLVRAIEATAFWAAVAMPFVYLPLVVTGVETAAEGIAVVALIALHVAALIVGRHYRAER